MLVKIFDDAPSKIGSRLNKWLEDEKPLVKHMSTASYQKGRVHVTILYDEPRQRPERVRGPERPGHGPRCVCGETMIRRERKVDGEPFWGCPTFPTCRHVVNFDDADHEADRNGVPDEAEFQGQSGYQGPGGFGPDDDDIPF